MSQILVRDLEPETLERLKQRAKRNRRSLQAEVRLILHEAAVRERRADPEARREAFERALANRRELEGKVHTDSVDIVRKIRGLE
jgi:plasmid stability protein